MKQPDAPPPNSEWRKLHLWQIQPLRDILVLAAIFALLYLGSVLSIVTVPLLLAMSLAYLFEPIVRRLIRVRWISRQGAALFIIVVAVFTIFVPVTVGGAYGVVQGIGFADRVSTNIILLNDAVENPTKQTRNALPNDSWRKLHTWLCEVREDITRSDIEDLNEPESQTANATNEKTTLARLFQTGATWVENNRESLSKQAYETGIDAVRFAIRTVSSLGFLLFAGFLTAFFFFFISTGYGKVLDFWESLIPERKRGRAIELARKMDAVIAGFVRGRITICAIQIVFFTIAYWIIGVPAPLVVGVIVGVLSIVPYVPLIGIPLTIILMWLDAGSGGFRDEWWWITGAPLLVYMAGQALDDYVLSPVIQGKSTGMDTPTILFASIAGGALAGIYGLLLAIPVAACIKIIITDVLWPHFKDWTEGKAEDPLPIAKRKAPNPE